MAWGCMARAPTPIRAGKLAGRLPAGDGKPTTHQRQQNYVKGRALAAIPAYASPLTVDPGRDNCRVPTAQTRTGAD